MILQAVLACIFTSAVAGQPAWVSQLQGSVYGDVFTAENTNALGALYAVIITSSIGKLQTKDGHSSKC